MTRTINLLSPEALERLQAGPEGTDVVSDLGDPTYLSVEPGREVAIYRDGSLVERRGGKVVRVEGPPIDPEPLPGVAGWEGAPLSATVDCGDCGHRVAFGKCCPHCAHGCSMPGDPECPANEE